MIEMLFGPRRYSRFLEGQGSAFMSCEAPETLTPKPLTLGLKRLELRLYGFLVPGLRVQDDVCKKSLPVTVGLIKHPTLRV